MVTLYVGKKEVQFTVHKDILCNKIPYFEKMFKGGFQEAADNAAKFPEDDPQSFDVLLGWVYEGDLRSLNTKGQEDEPLLSWSPGKLYALSDKLCLPELMDKIMDMQREWGRDHERFIPHEEAVQGYELSTAGSPYREYLATCCAFAIVKLEENSWRIEDLSDLLAKAPDLNLEVMKILREAKGDVYDPDAEEDCDFHTHEKDIPCPWEIDEDIE